MAILSHEEASEKVTDTGIMWRLAAYREVLEELERD